MSLSAYVLGIGEIFVLCLSMQLQEIVWLMDAVHACLQCRHSLYLQYVKYHLPLTRLLGILIYWFVWTYSKVLHFHLTHRFTSNTTQLEYAACTLNLTA